MDHWLQTHRVMDLLDPVIPLASTDITQPLINRVRVRRSGDWMIATASDRYVAGAARVPAAYDCPPDGWAVEISLADAKQWLTLAKSYRRAKFSAMPVRVDGQSLIVGYDPLSGGFDSELTLTLLQDRMPPVESLIKTVTRQRSAAPVEGWGLNADFLRKFSNAQRIFGGYAGTGRVLRLAHGEHLGISIQVGDDFVGVIMGVRLMTPRRPEWWSDVEADA